MFFKACVIGIFVIGVALADPISVKEPPSENSYDYESLFECELSVGSAEKGDFKYNTIDTLMPGIESNNVETHIHLIKEKSRNFTKHSKLENKWNHLKSSVHHVLESLKNKWHKFKHHGHTFDSARNRTMRLLNETHIIFNDIVMRGKKSYAAFEVFKTQLNQTLKRVEQDSEKVWELSEEWLKEIEDEVEKSRLAQAVNFLFTVTGLKDDWKYLNREWRQIHNHVVSLCTTVSDSLEKIENSTTILYRNVTTEMSVIKTNLVNLVDKATEEYRGIIEDSKETINDFKTLYKDIVTMFQDLKPMIGEVFEDVKDLLAELDDKLDEFVKLKNKLEKDKETVYIVAKKKIIPTKV